MRPINKHSERQLMPWQYALVSRATYYKAKRTMTLAGWPEDKPIDARAMIDFAPILRAATSEGYTLAQALSIYLAGGLDLSTPPHNYLTHQQAQALDKVKQGNIKKHGRNLDPSRDDVIHVERGQVMVYPLESVKG